MGILKLLTMPNEQLKQKAQKVVEFDQNLKNFAQDMIDTMKHYNGIGLASIQIANDPRFHFEENSEYRAQPNIVIVDVTETIAAVNIEIIEKSEEMIESLEGCLSIPNIQATIKRHAFITARYNNLDGTEQIVKLSGLAAICFQHEANHQEGVLFPDHLVGMQKLLFWKNYDKKRRVK